MSKIKILETNKNLAGNAQTLLDHMLAMQTAADQQIRSVKTIETKIIDIEKAKRAQVEFEAQKKAEALRLQELEAQKKAEAEARKPEEKETAAEVAGESAPEEKSAETEKTDEDKKEAPEVKKEKAAEPVRQKEKKAAEPPADVPAETAEKQPATKRPAAPAQPAETADGKPHDHGRKKPRPGGEEDSRNKKAKKAVIKERVFNIDEDDFPRGSRKMRHKKMQKPKMVIELIKIEKAMITEETVSVKLFSEKIGKPVSDILKKLLLLGMMSTINSQIDFDTAQLVAGEFGVELEQKIEKTAEDILVEEVEDIPDQLVKRPPVVTIMGHVDHGKTSLLDKIREARVTESEAGGITQHIGAYQVAMNDELITFIDTPGHEAFTAMRARGAQVTDIAIIVVAADDGIMPQTVEAINHAKSAEVPIIVAINKIDRENANPSKVMQELTEYELLPEAWGGDTVVVPVSAKTGEGIDKLLEMILLVAEVQELKANPNRLARGTIVEAELDKGRGPVATVLVENGTLHTGDTIIAGTAYGRVRVMFDDMGNAVEEAGPSMPVEVIGFSEVPAAGDILHAAPADKLTKQVAEQRRDRQKAEMLKKVSQVSLDDLFNQIAEGQIKDLNIVIKADVQGSAEAVKQSLEKLSNEEVRIKTIHSGAGAITEADVSLASAANAIVIGFNVRPNHMAMAAAEREKVDVRLYRVIYKAIEDMEAAINGMLEPEFEEVVTGHAEVRQTWKISSVGTIAGCYVTDGAIKRNSQVRLLRDNVVIHEGTLSSLKRFKDDAKEVAQGYECGLSLNNFNDVKEQDVVECFEMREIAR